MPAPAYPATLEQLRAERELVQAVRRLIALSSSSNEEEARPAARTACRLIREHGMLIAPGHADRVLESHQEAVERRLRGTEG